MIGNEKKWTKNCPKCGNEQTYTTKHTLTYSIEKNTVCNMCSARNKKIITPENGWSRNCPKCDVIMKYSCKSSYMSALRKKSLCLKCNGFKRKIVIPKNGWKRICKECGVELIYSCKKALVVCEKNDGLCRSCSQIKWGKTKDYSVFRTDEYREKQRTHAMKLVDAGIFNTENFKRKQREIRLKQIEKLGSKTNYNPNACKFMDEYGKQHGYNFQHALNGGEVQVCGYLLDGYDKGKNVIFEYDEPKHNKNHQRKKDLKRQNRLIEHLTPTSFIRFNEEYNEMVDVISGKKLS
jgi:hypothetical protein